MLFREIDVENLKEMKDIVELEKESFGAGAIDEWVIKPIARYGKIYVLYKEKKIIAFVEMLKKWGKEEAFIFSFAVSKKEQGKSYGKQLMAFTLDQLKKENIEKISLTVSEDNYIALKIYKSFGFKKVKILKNEYGKDIHRIYMEKDDLQYL